MCHMGQASQARNLKLIFETTKRDENSLLNYKGEKPYMRLRI